MQFRDKRVLITGSTKGLGKAMALAFAQEGAWVAINYHSDEAGSAQMEKELKELGAKYLLIKADVSRSDQVTDMVSRVLSAWEHVDVLVNNAGIIKDKMLLFLDEAEWDQVLDTNLKATYLCSKTILKSMIGRRFGRIINMTSPSALTGRPGQTNYAASKGGIISFTKSLAREVARLGITVNALCPGVIRTPLTEELPAKTREELLSLIPMAKFGETAEVAFGALFLASEKAGYMTGQVLVMDGGMT
ncbi:MAG: SDR family oxidoreductase [Desulfobacteraceae bacterium]|nr:MAG: SDR family oxidoreductase [Desulfobacteraceae bacterium]